MDEKLGDSGIPSGYGRINLTKAPFQSDRSRRQHQKSDSYDIDLFLVLHDKGVWRRLFYHKLRWKRERKNSALI